MSGPLAIDICCGLGGWTEGLLAEGYDVVGFDLERHRYPARAIPLSADGTKIQTAGVDFNNPNEGSSKNRSFNYANECLVRDAPLTGGWIEYPAQLVVQDVLTLHGRQFRDAALIVASPPCQAYSWMAMPWSKAKAKAAAIRADESGQMLAELNRLFDACFRIQREAIAAAGRHIPMVVENVRGAQPWVGRARWNFGSFYLWGDVPALMPMTNRAAKIANCAANVPGVGWTGFADKGDGVSWRNREKIGGDWFSDPQSTCRRHGSKFPARKFASATIAKIPLPLARWIAQAYYPRRAAA